MWGWVKRCFTNYAVFKGRASRPEYWYFYLFNLLINLAICGITLDAPDLRKSLQWGVGVFFITPLLAVASRRLHDTGHSVRWALAPILIIWLMAALALMKSSVAARVFAIFGGLMFVAFLVSGVLVTVLACTKGDPGPNRYGDPAPTEPG